MRRTFLLVVASFAVAHCNVSEGPPQPPDLQAQLARDAMDEASEPAQPDCGDLDRCPDRVVEGAVCIDDHELFQVSMLGAIVIDVVVDSARLAALGLAPGRYYTSFPDPTGGCALTLVSFEAPAREEGELAGEGGAP